MAVAGDSEYALPGRSGGHHPHHHGAVPLPDKGGCDLLEQRRAGTAQRIEPPGRRLQARVGSPGDPVRELAEKVCRAVGFKGGLDFDTSKPDGTPRKLLDVSRINALGWKARIGLDEGLAGAYAWYLANIAKAA